MQPVNNQVEAGDYHRLRRARQARPKPLTDPGTEIHLHFEIRVGNYVPRRRSSTRTRCASSTRDFRARRTVVPYTPRHDRQSRASDALRRREDIRARDTEPDPPPCHAGHRHHRHHRRYLVARVARRRRHQPHRRALRPDRPARGSTDRRRRGRGGRARARLPARSAWTRASCASATCAAAPSS